MQKLSDGFYRLKFPSVRITDAANDSDGLLSSKIAEDVFNLSMDGGSDNGLVMLELRCVEDADNGTLSFEGAFMDTTEVTVPRCNLDGVSDGSNISFISSVFSKLQKNYKEMSSI